MPDRKRWISGLSGQSSGIRAYSEIISAMGYTCAKCMAAPHRAGAKPRETQREPSATPATAANNYGPLAELTVYAYRGGSMLGTFRPGDRLPVETAPLDEIRPGDVVALRVACPTGAAAELVHRVVGLQPGGLVTRGDNNRRNDSGFVTAETLLGRVTRVERGGQIRPVLGGRLGLARARLLHARIRVRALAIRLGRVPYGWLRRSGLVSRLWRPRITRLRVATEQGPLVKYLSAGRTVARWWPEQNRFECARPYDLVIPRPDGSQ
jgi:signal peptidase I